MPHFIDTTEMLGRLDRLERQTPRALKAIFGRQASITTGQMKANAPWTDRTSAARSGLLCTDISQGDQYGLILAHAVSYGIWLEIANHGRYQIILPSLRMAMRELEAMINGLWGKIQ